MTKENNMQPFTFESTGISCFVRPVPPLLLNEVGRAFNRPEAPMQEIESPDGTKRSEPNKSHPDYLAALEDHARKIESASRAVMIKRGVVLDLTEEQRAEARTLRSEMAEVGITLDPSDEYVYICYIAIGSASDYKDLAQAIAERSAPTGPKSPAG
jgi:hypothetical protein